MQPTLAERDVGDDALVLSPACDSVPLSSVSAVGAIAMRDAERPLGDAERCDVDGRMRVGYNG
jgi:hypothetical protein